MSTPVARPLGNSQHDLPLPSSPSVTTDDITMVFCVRLHAGNPWIAARLDMMASYYDPCPRIIVVDFGSQPQEATIISDICQRRGYQYQFVDDFGVFSLSKARNIGASLCSSDFIFFCDPDFIGERDIFKRLDDAASALNMRETIDVLLNPPAFHLAEAETRLFENATDPAQKSKLIKKLSFTLVYAETSREDERYVAPYSNVFLINRRFFSLMGGYDTSFRGHGSEDFEFLLRYCIHAGLLPMPSNPTRNTFGPLTADFYRAKPYSGYRRLFELMSMPTEGLGFKVFHLHHPRSRDQEWYTAGDNKRTNFNISTSTYIDDHSQLLGVDFIDRKKTIACLFRNKDTWGYFTPLRLLDYKLIPVSDDDTDQISSLEKGLKSGEIDGIAIFNPYMKSNKNFFTIFELAKSLKRTTIVIERGALPETIYYDDDVCYASATFSEEEFSRSQFSSAELQEASAYIEQLRSGANTLEKMEPYSETAEKYQFLKDLKRTVCFIPLQLEDDMAVTMFIKGDQYYSEFVASLPELIKNNSEIVFILKPHPLSKGDISVSSENVIIAGREDNIHCLLDISDATLCYNSGVGLLSILHGKPTFTLGNAFYNMSGAGFRVGNASDAIDRIKTSRIPSPDRDLILRIAAWFTQRRYSRFRARDHIRNMEKRKAHDYKEIRVTEFRWRDHDLRLHRLNEEVQFSWKSYAGARMAPSHPVVPLDAGDSNSLIVWGFKDYREGNYAKAAEQLVRGYSLNPNQPNLLRHAAEAYLLAGDRKTAIKTQRQAVTALPKNQRVRLRLWTMRIPPLRFILGMNNLPLPQ